MVKITKKKLTCINSVHLSSNHGRKNVTDNSDDGSDYEQNDYDQPLKIAEHANLSESIEWDGKVSLGDDDLEKPKVVATVGIVGCGNKAERMLTQVGSCWCSNKLCSNLGIVHDSLW